MPAKIDLTGQRFGMLTVLAPAENIGRYTAWRCICDCGSEKIVRADHLCSGSTESCGCKSRELQRAKRIDLTGQRFGNLTVLAQAENIGHCAAWHCKCDCGAETVVTANNLRSGNTKSCGCIAESSDWLIDGTNVEILRSKKLSSNNTSGVRGVFWDKRRGRWVAHIGFKRKQYKLGAYSRFEDAVKARKCAEKEMHDKFVEEYDRSVQEQEAEAPAE